MARNSKSAIVESGFEALASLQAAANPAAVQETAVPNTSDTPASLQAREVPVTPLPEEVEAASAITPPPNHLTRADIFAAATSFGANEGAGATSKRDLALTVISAGDTPDGNPVIKPEDAEKLWDAFALASVQARGQSRISAEDNSKGTRDKEISNLRTFIKLGTRHRPDKGRDFVDCMIRVGEVFAANKPKLGKNERVLDCMLKIARAHLKDTKAHPTPMSDAEILEHLTSGRDSAPKTEDERELGILKSALTQLDSVYAGKKDKETGELIHEPRRSEDLKLACQAIERRINELSFKVSKYS